MPNQCTLVSQPTSYLNQYVGTSMTKLSYCLRHPTLPISACPLLSTAMYTLLYQVLSRIPLFCLVSGFPSHPTPTTAFRSNFLVPNPKFAVLIEQSIFGLHALLSVWGRPGTTFHSWCVQTFLVLSNNRLAYFPAEWHRIRGHASHHSSLPNGASKAI